MDDDETHIYFNVLLTERFVSLLYKWHSRAAFSFISIYFDNRNDDDANSASYRGVSMCWKSWTTKGGSARVYSTQTVHPEYWTHII